MIGYFGWLYITNLLACSDNSDAYSTFIVLIIQHSDT